jgi:hypothetical protein
MKTKLLLGTILTLLCSFSHGQNTFRDTVFFGFNKSTLSTNDQGMLRADLERKLVGQNVISIHLTGHTDHVSGSAYNKSLAKRRVATVRKQLKFLVLHDSIFTSASYGKENPAFGNSDDYGRSKNRRVNITVQYEAEELEFDSLVTEEPELLVDRDTTIYGPEGTEIIVSINAFYPYDIKDVDFKIREVFSKKSMILNDMPTMTSDGQCLESGGMVFSNAMVGDEEVTPNDTMTIRIPADKIDTTMKIFSVEVVDGDTLWKATSMDLNFNAEGGYYEFRTPRMPNFNIDKIPVVSTVASPVVKIMELFKDQGLVVKSKRCFSQKSYLVSTERTIVLKGDIFKPKKSRYKPCDFDPNNVVVSVAQRKGQLYYFARPLGTLKYKRFFNRYLIKRKLYEKIEPEDLDEKLDQFS